MRISVLITCYNLERYIGEAIESVLKQDYSGEIEIIVVDDASTDGSARIIQGYDRLRYIRMEENSGVLLATVRAIEESTADLVFFLDGDDVWLPGKIKAVADRMSIDPDLALITHDLVYIDHVGKLLDQRSIPEKKMSVVTSEHESEKIRDGILMQDDYVGLGSAFGLRKSKCRVGEFCAWAKFLPDPRNTYQDWPLAFWVAALPDARMAYVHQKLFRYRLHGANHSGDASTTAKAYRNILRGRNTTASLLDIARSRQLSEKMIRSIEKRLRFSDYLLSLYAGQRIAALRGFVWCLPTLFSKPDWIAKEVVRFFFVQLFGPAVLQKIRR